jgi:hypothetical protein
VREPPRSSRKTTWGLQGGLHPGDDTETMPGS